MDYSSHRQDKLNALKIKGQSRPFVDPDLQLRFPGVEDLNLPSSIHLCCRVYSHFIGMHSSKGIVPSSVNETGINQAMEEANQSYQAWKQLKNHLLKVISR